MSVVVGIEYPGSYPLYAAVDGAVPPIIFTGRYIISNRGERREGRGEEGGRRGRGGVKEKVFVITLIVQVHN